MLTYKILLTIHELLKYLGDLIAYIVEMELVFWNISAVEFTVFVSIFPILITYLLLSYARNTTIVNAFFKKQID